MYVYSHSTWEGEAGVQAQGQPGLQRGCHETKQNERPCSKSIFAFIIQTELYAPFNPVPALKR